MFYIIEETVMTNTSAYPVFVENSHVFSESELEELHNSYLEEDSHGNKWLYNIIAEFSTEEEAYSFLNKEWFLI